MHERVKKLSTKKHVKKQASCIMEKKGKLLFEQDEIERKWVEYISNLYDDNRDEIPQFNVTSGENILKGEVEKAIKTMKDGRAMGRDEYQLK